MSGGAAHLNPSCRRMARLVNGASPCRSWCSVRSHSDEYVYNVGTGAAPRRPAAGRTQLASSSESSLVPLLSAMAKQ